MYLFTIATGLTAAAPAKSLQQCKPVPGSVDWPSVSQWQALNTSLSGRLFATELPGLACHPDQSHFNNATCSIALENWTNSSWHADNPFTTNYNDGCTPNATIPCVQDSYPAYAIEADSVADVQAGVKFAADTNVRLTIKATGHDFPGRSSGANAVSIWTHNIRGVEIYPEDPRAVRYGAVASIKIAAGMHWGEVYDHAITNNLTVVGGAALNVGVIGWSNNGGHSPISSVYGMGADQILEMEVVTPDGEFRVVNETSYPDLFFACRGGGGSTYAVVTSITVKAYPPLSGSFYSTAYTTTAASDTFWSLAAYFHTQLPALSEAGAQGYFYVTPNISTRNPSRNGQVALGFFFANRSPAQTKVLMAPLEAALNSSSWSKDPVFVSSDPIQEIPNFLKFWTSVYQAEPVGFDGRLASRILDGPALASARFDHLKTTFQEIAPVPWSILGHLVAGPGPRNAPAVLPGGPGSNAVLPAWRKGYVHLVTPRIWEAGNATQKAYLTTDMRENLDQAFKSLAPDTGAYVNEADPSNPNWKDDYYGENYARLLEIKRKWDPKGVLWCKPCVGWDDWEIIDGPADEDEAEWGIGNGLGRLCRTK